MVVRVTCKNEEDPFKNEGTRMVTTFPILSIGIFPDAQGQLTPLSGVRSCLLQFELILAFMVVLVICKKEVDRIKNEGPRVLFRLYVDFSDTKGPLTP